MNEYTLNIPLSAVENRCGKTLEDLEDLLLRADLQPILKKSDIRLICPCSPNIKDPSLSVYLKDGPKWKCHRCDASRKKFNNLAGLIRVYHDKNPWEAVNHLFDLAFANETKSKTRLPIALDNYKNKFLHEIPPHKLYWLLIAGSAEIINQGLKDEITARLYDVAPF